MPTLRKGQEKEERNHNDSKSDTKEAKVYTSEEYQQQVEKGKVMDELLEYAKKSQEMVEKRVRDIVNREEMERIRKENERKEEALFKANAFDIADMLGAPVFYAHRMLDQRLENINPSINMFVFTKTPQSKPGELSIRILGDEMIIKPWNEVDKEIRFITPDVILASKNNGKIQRPPETSSGPTIRNALRGRKGTINSNFPYHVKVGKNQVVDARRYGGARRVVNTLATPGNNNNHNNGGVNGGLGFVGSRASMTSKKFPGSLTHRDYPLEVKYTGANRFPNYSTIIRDSSTDQGFKTTNVKQNNRRR